MNEANKLARTLKILAVGTRVRIVQILRERTLCVNALATRLGVTQSAVSQHLRVMRDAGLVIDERCGYRVHYRLNLEIMADWRDEINALLTPLDKGCPKNKDQQKETPSCLAIKKARDAGNRKT